MHVGTAEVWSAARPPTDTWQSTAGALRKQPPRDAQQAGVRGREARKRRRLPSRVPIRPHPSSKSTSLPACDLCMLMLLRRTLPRRPPAPLRSFQPTHRFGCGWVGTAEDPTPGRSPGPADDEEATAPCITAVARQHPGSSLPARGAVSGPVSRAAQWFNLQGTKDNQGARHASRQRIS
jgi:hypothetical protein